MLYHIQSCQSWPALQIFTFRFELQLINHSFTDIFHCAYLKCPLKSGLVPVEHIENCIKQLDGFACNLNDTSNNITTGKIHVTLG